MNEIPGRVGQFDGESLEVVATIKKLWFLLDDDKPYF